MDVAEQELLIFELNKNTYGINVSDVKEIIKMQKVTPMPNANNRTYGVFMPRDELISVIDLRYVLFKESSKNTECKYIVICYLNDELVAYPIDDVIGIKRVGENDISAPDKIVDEEDNVVTGIAKLENMIISILDLQKI